MIISFLQSSPKERDTVLPGDTKEGQQVLGDDKLGWKRSQDHGRGKECGQKTGRTEVQRAERSHLGYQRWNM